MQQVAIDHPKNEHDEDHDWDAQLGISTEGWTGPIVRLDDPRRLIAQQERRAKRRLEKQQQQKQQQQQQTQEQDNELPESETPCETRSNADAHNAQDRYVLK
mgnify:CR=1 FL=1